jgi:hypothetical protein
MAKSPKSLTQIAHMSMSPAAQQTRSQLPHSPSLLFPTHAPPGPPLADSSDESGDDIIEKVHARQNALVLYLVCSRDSVF